MFNILLWQSAQRIVWGVCLLLASLMFMPQEITYRLWFGLGLGLLCPLLVLGRRHSLNREAYALILSALPRQRRWQIWGLTPAFFIIFLWATLIAQGSWKIGLIFLSWGVACVSLSDLFDKRRVRLAEAWGWSSLCIMLLASTPFGALYSLAAPLFLHGSQQYASVLTQYILASNQLVVSPYKIHCFMSIPNLA